MVLIMETGADIIAVVDGTPGDNDMPTELIFRTTADGDSSTSRMRIVLAAELKLMA